MSWKVKVKKKKKKTKGRCVALFLLFQILFPAECSWVDRLAWWRCIIVVYLLYIQVQGVRCCITICNWTSILKHKYLLCVFAPRFGSGVLLVHGRLLAQCFWEGTGIRPTNTCPNVLQRVFVLVRILAHVFEVYASVDEYLPRVSGRVFGRRTNTGPSFWDGIRPSTSICLTNRTRSQRIRVPIRIRIRAGCEILTHHHCMFVL